RLTQDEFAADQAATASATKREGNIAMTDTPAAAGTSAASTAPMTPGNAASAVTELMKEHVALMRDIHKASLETLRVSLDRQRQAMSGSVGKVAEKIDGQTSDFLASMGQFTNDLG